MKLRKISAISIIFLSAILFMTVVSASGNWSAKFDFPTQKNVVIRDKKLEAGVARGKATYGFTLSNSELNMTLARKKILGYDTAIRCWNMNTYKNTSSECTFTSDLSKGTYMSTIILNSSDGRPVAGEYVLYNN